MKTKFILSLDCEGKWGIADKLTRDHEKTLGKDRLEKAYDDILGLLDTNNIAATFAFVGLFQKSLSELENSDWDLLLDRFPYVKNAYEDIFNGSQDGWSGNWAVRNVRNAAIDHEIGCHGGTHTPFDQMDGAQAKLDLTFCPDIDGQTFIYPRGGLGHIDVLQQAGIAGYRLVRPGTKVSRILDEINLFHGPELCPPPASPVEIPAGYFINWKSGIRNLIPVIASRMRIRSIFEKAGTNGGVIHFWSHPENIASAPATLEIMEIVLSEAARAREKGLLQIVTQKEYCDYQLAATSTAS